MRKAELTVADADGDTLSVKEVFGFGEPMLCVEVAQEGDFALLNLSVPDAARLRDHLDQFVKRHTAEGL